MSGVSSPGSSSVSNSAYASDGTISSNTDGTNTPISSAVISKYAEGDVEDSNGTKYITWKIVINKSDLDMTLKDEISAINKDTGSTESVSLPNSFELTRPDGSKETINSSVNRYKLSGSAGQYTITYKTAVPAAGKGETISTTNKVTTTKDGKEYSGTGSKDYPYPDTAYNATKSFVKKTDGDNDEEGILHWESTI